MSGVSVSAVSARQHGSGGPTPTRTVNIQDGRLRGLGALSPLRGIWVVVRTPVRIPASRSSPPSRCLPDALFWCMVAATKSFICRHVIFRASCSSASSPKASGRFHGNCPAGGVLDFTFLYKRARPASDPHRKFRGNNWTRWMPTFGWTKVLRLLVAAACKACRAGGPPVFPLTPKSPPECHSWFIPQEIHQQFSHRPAHGCDVHATVFCPLVNHDEAGVHERHSDGGRLAELPPTREMPAGK